MAFGRFFLDEKTGKVTPPGEARCLPSFLGRPEAIAARHLRIHGCLIPAGIHDLL